MNTTLFQKNDGTYLLASPDVTDADVKMLLSDCKEAGQTEVRIKIPASVLKLFEENGCCADGVIFSENDAQFFYVHRSFIFDDCDFLSFDPDVEVVLTRTSFHAEKTVKATLNITALGFFEAYVNGSPVSTDRLVPAKSDYVQRDLSHLSYPIFDTMSHRIYYYEYDITHLLKNGENILATQIGNGWYGDSKNTAEGVPQWGEKFLLFQITLESENGEKTVLCSKKDNTVWHRSHILESSLYYGEYHNYLKYMNGWNEIGLNASDWKKTKLQDPLHTFFQKADFPADTYCGEIRPLLLKKYGDHKLYDLGETAAGVPVIKGTEKAQRNSVITLRYADLITPDASLELRHTGGEWRAQEDRFILSSDYLQKELYPRLLWHASRYIELTGQAELIRFQKIQTPIKRISAFQSDSKTLNWFFSSYVRTQEANIHGCVPSDCPHRERLGYTGDGQLTCGAVMSVFDARKMYKKWMQDIRDCQDIYNGHIQHTAPFYGGGGGPGGWGGAVVIVPYRYYHFYNDFETLEISYPSMKAYMDYMLAHCSDYVVTHEEPGGWCLGDWCPPDNKILIPESFVNTYFFAKCAGMCAEVASILEKPEDSQAFSALETTLKDAITRHFYDPDTGSFCGGVQGADAFAVDLGIGDERTLQNLTKKYTALQTFDTGIFGTDILLRVLFRNGQASLAYKLLTNEKETSFFNMMRHGSRNLWENWDGCDSLCHPMFGAPVEYLFSEILGIKRLNNAPGYKNVVIEPADIPELKNVSGTMGTPWGKITVIIATDKFGKRNVSYFADPGIHVQNSINNS